MTSLQTPLCTIFLALLILCTPTKAEQTKLIIELFRHGARNPLDKIDILPIDDSREDYEDLTTTGMRNHYDLGKMLRKKFEKYLPQILTPGVLAIKSSDPLRTVNSAISQINGMFTDGAQIQIETPDSPQFWNPPGFPQTSEVTGNNSLPGNINIDAVRPQNDDNNYLFSGDSSCPASDIVYKENRAAWKRDYVDSYKNSYQVFEQNGYSSEAIFGEKDWTLKNATNLTDNLLSSIFNNSEFKWNYELLLHAITIHAIQQASYGNGEFVNKFANHSLFKEWKDWIEKLERAEKQAADAEDPIVMPKIAMYSGHDTNIAQVVGGLFKKDNFDCLQSAYQKYVVNADVQNKADYDAIQDKIRSDGCFYTFQFASNIIIEIFVREDPKETLDILDTEGLLEASSNKEYLMARFFYNGVPFALDQELEMPIADLKKKLGKLTFSNFKKQCADEFLKNKNPQSQLKVIAIILILLVLVCLLATVGASCVKERSRSPEEGTGEKLMDSGEHEETTIQDNE